MVRELREKRHNEQKGDKRFGGEGGAGVLHWQRGGQIGQWKYTGRRGPGRSHSATVRCNGGSHSEGSHSVTGRDAAGGAPGMRVAKSPEFKEGEQ